VVELVLLDGLDGAEVEDGGVVDEDVNLQSVAAKVFLSSRDDSIAALGFADVCSAGDRLDAVLFLEFLTDSLCRIVRGGGGVVDEDVGTLGCEVASDERTDA
jgi:hypothetical protein